MVESRWHPLTQPAHVFLVQQRQRHMITLLRQFGMAPLDSLAALEIGSGSGAFLVELITWGAVGKRLCGVDLSWQRSSAARTRLTGLNLVCADAQRLPFEAATCDLEFQVTAFSSMLDAHHRDRAAREMLRVLKPNGLILWYDFWLNPTNPQTRGIRPAEIRRLFPGCTFDFRRITLAPPIARLVVPLSWTLALLLEKLVVFNSHYLVAIRKANSAA